VKQRFTSKGLLAGSIFWSAHYQLWFHRPGQARINLGFEGWHPNSPPDGYQISASNYIYFPPTSRLGLNYRDQLVARFLMMTGIAVRFFGPSETVDKATPPREFVVFLRELLEPQHVTFLGYQDGKLTVSSGSTWLRWTPLLDWRWRSGTAIPSVVDLLGTRAEFRPILSNYVCQGVGDVERCRRLEEKYKAALRARCLTISFPSLDR
jgi:hypothetical protein